MLIINKIETIYTTFLRICVLSFLSFVVFGQTGAYASQMIRPLVILRCDPENARLLLVCRSVVQHLAETTGGTAIYRINPSSPVPDTLTVNLAVSKNSEPQSVWMIWEGPATDRAQTTNHTLNFEVNDATSAHELARLLVAEAVNLRYKIENLPMPKL